MAAGAWSRLPGADRSGRFVLDRADNRGEHGAGHAATGHLADDAADIRRRGGIGQQRNQRICPPAPPPIAPAMVFPSVPRSMFLAAPAATLPPTAPLMTWMIRLMSNPDMTLNSRDPVFGSGRMRGAGPSPRRHNLAFRQQRSRCGREGF